MDTIFEAETKKDAAEKKDTLIPDLSVKDDNAITPDTVVSSLLGPDADKDDELFQQLAESTEFESVMENSLPYLVRSTQLYCTCGTHKRKLNLPIDHGVYILGKPLICEEDCVEEVNISSFGICQSEDNPVNKSWWKKLGDTIFGTDDRTEEQKEAEEIILKAENGENVKGYACTPCIVSKWKEPYVFQKMARNGTEGRAEGEQMAALTMDSFLVCAYGGTIQPVTSGQEDE